MHISRMDLDGKGSGSPEGLIGLILKAQPLTVPVDIEELAYALDIEEIAELKTEGFEGGLLTDECRSRGIILVNRTAGLGRRRFTIGHELAHFLLPSHKPVKTDQFLCSREDMATWTAAEQAKYQRMEAEANRFSALILMPPPLLRPYLGRMGDPSITGLLTVSADFVVSKDAAARAYAQYHDEPVAMVVAKDGLIQRVYKNTRFPKLGVSAGHPVPRRSAYHGAIGANLEMSPIVRADAGQWLESDWGRRLPDVYEQVLVQSHGFALIMLWAELADEDDEDEEENLTSAQRLARRRGSDR